MAPPASTPPSAAPAFTGERPGRGENFDYDEARHLAAYLYAATLATGKRVLDAGCGEGLGTEGLARVADEVVGVDYSAEAIEFCRRSWQRPNLRFVHLDLTRPTGFDESFDLVLNFQVLEHIRDDQRFVESLAARLAPGGTLLLTTPNRLRSFSENPYHVREYIEAELRSLLERVFGEVAILGMHGNEKVNEFDRARERSVRRILRLDPLGIRHLLPEKLLHFTFARLARLVRRQARTSAGSAPIRPEDFTVRADGVDAALDLVAVCKA